MMNKIFTFMTRHTAMIYGGIAVCVVCIFLFPYGKRLYDQFPRYEWEPNHQGNVKNKEAFGAKYLDEYLHETWLGKIYVETEEDALRKFRNKRANYLFFNNYDKDSLEIANIISNANKGNRYIFVGTNTDLIENLDINATAGNEYFDIKEFHYGNHERKTLIIKNGKGKSTTSIRLWGEMAYDNFMSSALDQDSIIVHTPFYHCYGNLPKGTYTPLISLTSGYDIAARRNIGNGCITIVYSFAFFTNYAASDDDMRKGMEHVMNATFDKRLPLVIVYNEEESSGNLTGGSSFSVLLSHPCTALFLWLLLLALLLAVFVNGRRRQRAESEHKKSANSSISYIRHLATIYTKDTDYSELLKIEKRVLLYKLRKEYYFDMRTRDYTEVSQFAEHIANTKHLDKEAVKEVLTTLEELTAPGVQVDDKAYRVCLEQIQPLSP